MDVLQQDRPFWHLVHHLVFREKLRVIEISPDQREVWLEQEQHKEAVLRIARTDINSNHWLRKDIEKASQKFELLRKQMGSRSLFCYNIYVTSSSEDLLEDFTQKPYFAGKKNRTEVHTLLIKPQQFNYQTSKLFECLRVQPPNIDIWFERIKDEGTLKNEVITEAKRRLEEEKKLFFFGKPIFTSILIVYIVFIFIWMEYHGSSMSSLTLIEFGAKYNPLIIHGQWWRLFTSTLLHVGVLHLFMNMLALFYLGRTVERIYGTARFIIIYIIAGLFGSLSSFVFNVQISAGASGAIFGCFGALLYFGVVHRKLFFRTLGMSVIIILLLNLILGFIIPAIDNGAHIGGLIGGFLASSVVQLPKQNLNIRQLSMFALTGMLIFSLFHYGYTSDPRKGAMVNVQIAQEILEQADEKAPHKAYIRRAYRLLKEAVDYDVDTMEAYFLLAFTEVHLGYYEDAKEHLFIVLKEKPNLHEAYYNLAIVYLELGQLERAFVSIDRALFIKHFEVKYFTLRQKIIDKYAEANLEG